MADPSIGVAALTRTDLREELDRSFARIATKEDLAAQRADLDDRDRQSARRSEGGNRQSAG